MADRAGRPKKVESYSTVVDKFSAHYKNQFDDQSNITEAERKERQEKAAQVVDSYYDFASQAYEANWSTHFHYTPFPPSYPPSDSTIATAMVFHEHRLALLLHLRPGMKILDVGCGIGGPAREIAKFTGCEVVGISINQGQIDRAILLTAMEGLQHRCTFVKGDFLNMPFKEGSFDAAFAIDATVHASSLLRVYSETARVLKPGGVFGVYEWVMTPKYEPDNPRHVAVRNRIERGNSLVNLHTSDQARKAFLQAGFELEHEEDFAIYFDYARDNMLRNKNNKTTTTTKSSSEILSSPILIPFPTGPRVAPPPSKPLPLPLPIPLSTYRPWTFALRGHTHLATTWTDWWTCFKLSPLARRLCYVYVLVGERVGFVDKGVMQAMRTMAICVDAAVEGGEEGIFSPSWLFVGRKGGKGGKVEGGVLDGGKGGE